MSDETKRADSGAGTPAAETAGSEPERSPARPARMTEARLEELGHHAASQNEWENWGKLEEACLEIRRQRFAIERALRWCEVAEQNGCDGSYFKDIRIELE